MKEQNVRAAHWSIAVASVVATMVVSLAAQNSPVQEKRLSEGQRAEIFSLIKAVDDAAEGRAEVAEPPQAWEAHFLQAMDELVYVPMTLRLKVPDGTFASATLYVRVVARGATAAVAHSGLRDWLMAEALRGRPRPAPIQGFLAVNPDEMPVGGPAMTSGESSGINQAIQGGFTALRLLETYGSGRDEQRMRHATGGRESNIPRDRPVARHVDSFVYPFEDFDSLEFAEAGAGTSRRLDRAVAVPAGEYDLYIAVRETAGPKSEAPRTFIYRQPLTVPDLSAGLAMSSVILADHLGALQVPYTPERQAAHPYALGWTDISPAIDDRFSDQEEMGVVFQVLNPAIDDAKKPNVTVDFNFHHQADSEETLATTARLDFNRTTLPPDFDLAAGHQLFTARLISLKTFAPGDYRLELKVTDRKAAKTVSTSVGFTVVASANSMWVGKTVSSLLAPAFRRDDVLATDAVSLALDRLRDVGEPAASAAVKSAIDSARAGQYAMLLNQVATIDDNELAATFLRGLGLMALNGNLEAAAGQFRDALRVSSEFLPSAMYLGACYAAGGRDREAIAAWQVALADEASTPILHILVADAYLRLGDTEQALDILSEASERWPADDRITKRLATAHLLAHNAQEAMNVLEPYLERHGDDLDALFLAIQSLHESAQAGQSTGRDNPNAAKLVGYCRAYLAAKGPYQTVVEQWLNESTQTKK